jgi:hypothetical protein
MRASGESWKVWLSASVGAVVVVVLSLSLFRAPVLKERPDKAQTQSTTKVELSTQENELLIEEVALRDPTPLFVPTQWNAGEDALAMSAPREPGGSFQDYAPFFTYSATELNLEFPNTLDLPEKPSDVFAIDGPSRAFTGLGQTDEKMAPLPSRVGFMEVVGANNGEVLLRQRLEGSVPPEQGSWQPMEFLVAVDAAGMVRPPVLAESSRVAEVDSFFKEYLSKVVHIGERLSPGFYRISIGP